jgi:hypothetical protein
MISMANIRINLVFCNSKDKITYHFRQDYNSKDKIAYLSDKIACSEYLMKQKRFFFNLVEKQQ